MTFEPGTFVQVVGQVAKDQHHPEDVHIVVRSHNQDIDLPVMRERVTVCAPPVWAEICTSMVEHESYDGLAAYLRCERPHGHAKKHARGHYRWTDSQASGYFEEK